MWFAFILMLIIAISLYVPVSKVKQPTHILTNLPDSCKSTLIGREYRCGKFFWIKNCIGFEDNAEHGHDSFDRDSPGSIDATCSVVVKRICRDKNITAVVVRRPVKPYGAEAAIGTIFMVPLHTLEVEWPNELEQLKAENEAKDTMLALVKK